jgi:uncharacterized protein YbaA (DUF1428 family)
MDKAFRLVEITRDNFDARAARSCRTSPSPFVASVAATSRANNRRTAMNYVDGFVIAVPNAKREAYRQLAQDASAVFKDHGALSVVECWGDDVPEGKVTSFSMAVQRKPDESVVFSWIVWPSRQARDEGMKKSMEDPRMNHDPKDMPFDGQRMIFGGFDIIVEA